jgi:hypothetical protein
MFSLILVQNLQTDKILKFSPIFMFNSRFFSFSTIGHNDRGYGLGRSAGEFPVVKRQGKCGRKDCQKHIKPP